MVARNLFQLFRRFESHNRLGFIIVFVHNYTAQKNVYIF
jgi:hypothetical protein